MLGCRPFRRAGASHSLYHNRQAQGQDQGRQRGEKCQGRSGQAGPQSPIGGDQARGAQAPPARDRRFERRGCRAQLGPGHVHAEGRGGRAGQAGRDLEPAGAREAHRSGTRQAARRPRAPCRAPALRLRRCEPRARRAPRLRQGDQGAGRVRRPLERVRLDLLRCLDAGAPGQRLRHHAPAARAGARLQPPIRRLLRALQAHRRPADRRARRGHDDGLGAGAVQGAARRAGADRARHRRAAAGRRRLPARHVSGGGADGVRPRRHQALRLRPRPRPARQDAPSLLHQIFGRRRAHHHARLRERHRPGAVLDPARGGPRALRAGRQRRSRGHAAGLGRVRRRAREPVAAVGERGRPQPRLLGAFLSAAARRLPRALQAACRSRRSIAPSTRSSGR